MVFVLNARCVLLSVGVQASKCVLLQNLNETETLSLFLIIELNLFVSTTYPPLALQYVFMIYIMHYFSIPPLI